MAQPKFKANIQTTKPENDLELIQRIGSGTYGEVYKANVKATGALAAVKIINIEAGDDFDLIQQEIIIMQDCKHQNIVQYFGSYLRRDKLWIAMEYCGGGSLQDIYHVTGALTEPMIGFTCTEMLKGLHYMHNQKKLHRDIKGANILLTSEGDVKLADFGVGAQISSTIGKRSSFIGTPYWMAPEVAAVERTGGYDHLCDIWAVGITAIELAECQPPLFDLHPMRALYLISKKNYTPPTLKNKGKWSSHFRDFLKQSLTKNPKRRPDSDRLLNHAFCKENGNKRSFLRELLDNHERLKEKKKSKMYSHYSSDEEVEKKDEKTENKETEPEKKVTVKRIQSKKENKKKERPAAPPQRDAVQPDKANEEEFTRAHITRKEPPVDETSNETVDTSTIKAPPKKNLPPPPPPSANLPPQPTSAPPPPPPSQRPPPPSVEHKYVGATSDDDVPPLPPRDSDTLKPSGADVTLGDVSCQNPPPLPPRLPITSRKLHNERPQSQLFTQKAAKNCFTKIFNECPLNMLHAASWKNPDTKSNCILFASNEGVYSLNLEDTSNIEMVQIFARPCKWVYVVKNMLVSICGVNTSSVYMHNLISLHSPKENIDKLAPGPKGIAYTVKIPGTANTLKCCVAHNPYNNEVYLYAGRRDGVMIMQWYEPLQKFMIVKDIPCTLPPELPIFEPIVQIGVEHTSICVGAYQMPNGDFLLDKIDVEKGTIWELNTEHKKVDIKSLSQLEPNNILIAYGRTVQFIDIDGKPMKYSSNSTKLVFDNDIMNAICLPGSVLTFSKHGVQGKGFINEQVTAQFQDHTRQYKLLCSDRIVVIESYETAENYSNLYILASGK